MKNFIGTTINSREYLVVLGFVSSIIPALVSIQGIREAMGFGKRSEKASVACSKSTDDFKKRRLIVRDREK